MLQQVGGISKVLNMNDLLYSYLYYGQYGQSELRAQFFFWEGGLCFVVAVFNFTVSLDS